MFRMLIITMCLFLLAGCTGSAYQLPEVSSADVKLMQEKVAKDAKPLKTYKRSDQQYKSIIAGITSKLTKNAKPLCQQSGYEACFFQVNYDPSSTVNAYASEGYKITLYKGLLQYLQYNDEIAAVVAHEMGHHLANHNEETAKNAATGAAISGIVTTVLLAAANADSPYYMSYQEQQNQQKAIENMMKAGAHLGVMSYSKEQEREADLLATYLLSRAGYDLAKAQNMMVVLAQFNGETGDSSQKAFLESHPAGMERVIAWAKAREEIKNNKTRLPYLKQNKSVEKTPQP